MATIPLNLDYTGHPLLDVGLATLTAMAHKGHPRQLTEADLASAAEFMKKNYVVDPLKSFLSVAFPNSGFTQPAYEKQPEKRRIYAENVLGAWRSAAHTDMDPLTGLPATATPLDVKSELPPGRAFRQHVPLLTGEDVINFFPYGDAGLPLSGLSVLAFQALPMGCAKVSGRLLAVHSDSPELLLHFARTFWEVNRRNLLAAQAAGERKLPDTGTYQARTLLIYHLLEAEKVLQHQEEGGFTLTAYHFTNSGQGADLTIYPLPLEVGAFLRTVQSPNYRPLWEALVARGWQLTSKPGDESRYNRLYEDLFALPEAAPSFIRRYFLRIPRRSDAKDKRDPTLAYDTRKDIDLVSWSLTELFLRKVVLMNDERIAHIRNLGDALADYIAQTNDRGFFNAFWMARNYNEVRAALIRASQAEVKRGRPPLVTLDQFLAVFEQVEGVPMGDWRLGRDLVLIRLLERLYQQGWLKQHVDVLSEALPVEEE